MVQNWHKKGHSSAPLRPIEKPFRELILHDETILNLCYSCPLVREKAMSGGSARARPAGIVKMVKIFFIDFLCGLCSALKMQSNGIHDEHITRKKT